jgi:heptosyltransferase-1
MGMIGGSARLPDLSAVDDVRSILIVRLKALGDIVLSFPIVTALRKRFPEADLMYLCWEQYAEALSGDTDLDEVIILPENLSEQISLLKKLRRRRIDLVLDLLGSPRSALITLATGARIRIGMDVGRHRWCYHYLLPRVVIRSGKRTKCYTLESNNEIVRMLNLWKESGGEGETASRSPGRSISPEGEARRLKEEELEIGFPAAEGEMEWAQGYINGLGVEQSKIIGIAPGVTYQSKSWPLEHFIELVRILKENYDVTPIVLWGPGEQRMAKRIVKSVPGVVMAPETGIAQLGALMALLSLLVTLDSGPKHLAVIQGVPTVTLFGPTDPCVWNPQTAKHHAVYLALSCSPCRKRECEPNLCLTGIEPEIVANAVADMLHLSSRTGKAVTER